MQTIETTTPTKPTTVLPENAVAGRTWSNGGAGYDRISNQIADAIEHCVDRIAVRPGERVLDAATGTGWAARRLHARGAQVTGIDFGEGVIAAAKDLSPSEIEYQVADIEALPFADGTFDVVTSTFGVMFCGNPERAAAELARVCKAGGRIAMANWATHGGVIEMFKLIRSHFPVQPPPAPSPFEWGRTERQVELLGEYFDLSFEDGTSFYREPSGEAAWNTFSSGFGPVVTLLHKLDTEAAARFRDEFIAFHERRRTGIGILVQRPYVITHGVRR
jgi:ubiquinone/menaquinone biosynthesis C-methylase UbiE